MPAEVSVFHPSIHLQRNRELPVHGVVKVKAGQMVGSLDVLAEEQIPSGHFIVDVFSALHTKTPEDAERLIIRKPGDTLEKDDIIAQTKGFLPRILRTPGPGKVITIVDGRVLIGAEDQRVQLFSGYPGTVVDVQLDKGVVIESDAALLQGVWGNGRFGAGELVIDDEFCLGEVNPSLVVADICGKVVAGDHCHSAEVLNQAALAGIAGLVLGSMSSALITTAEEQPYPIILLNGFGDFGLDKNMRDLLINNIGEAASLMAAKWDRLKGVRPEVIIPHEKPGIVMPALQEFQTGCTVRVHASENTGRFGTFVKVLPGLVALPNGLTCKAAEVEFENGKLDLVPLVNLDIIKMNTFHPIEGVKEDEYGTN